jgi:hypothetical protein
VTLSRPQTHDLLASVIEAMGGRIERITVTHLAEGTFFAELSIRLRDGSIIGVDSRPSDAIALGIANDAPIYVAEVVLESAMRDEP